MKKLSAAAGLALALAAGSAIASDLPSHKAPTVYVAPPPVFNWTGLYGGVNIGYGFGAGDAATGNQTYFNTTAEAPDDQEVGPLLSSWSLPTNLSGIVGGGQVGFNYQFSPWLVLGVEADIQGADLRSSASGISSGAGFIDNPNDFFLAQTNARQSVDWWGTWRARAGVTLLENRLLLYGTAGLAYGGVNHEFSKIDWFSEDSGEFFGGLYGRTTINHIQFGWTAGAGLEWMFMPGWSVKLEYLYTDLGSTLMPISGAATIGTFESHLSPSFFGTHSEETRFHTVRVGVNYHFNSFAPAAVLAKY